MSNAQRSFERFRPSKETLLWGVLLVNTELLLVAAYLALSDAIITEYRFLVYPFVWLNVSVWALARIDPLANSRRNRLTATAVAVGYFVVLAYAGGLWGLAHHAAGFRISWLPPGWGPALLYSGQVFTLSLIPYKLVGYLTLAYLVYATVLDAAGSVVSGVVGLFSCVSCTWPILATFVTGVAGSGTAIAAATTEWSYALSTVIFTVTVGLLLWRPSFGK